MSPKILLGCPVCFSYSSEETLIAYYFTTGLLIVLPLACIGILVWWVYKATKKPKVSPTKKKNVRFFSRKFQQIFKSLNH